MSEKTEREKTDQDWGLRWWVRYGCVPVTVAIIAGISAVIAVILTRTIPEALADRPTAAVTSNPPNIIVVTATDAPTTSIGPTPTQTAPPTATPTPILIGQHIVNGGDTLYCVGRAYGVQPNAIAQANSLVSPFTLHRGQVLKIPTVLWPVIPPGPICAQQFSSPFASLHPMLTPVSSLPKLTDTPTPAPSDTPTPGVILTITTPALMPTTNTPYSAVNLPPMVTIIFPALDASYGYDGRNDKLGLWYTIVTLQGSATDLEDGTLNDSSLVWATDRKDIHTSPTLGIGTDVKATLYSNDPCNGVWHTITLTATDSGGNVATAARIIFIGTGTLC
ncbi:MAG: LysM peptidoglycan-binding domain-containing protein [Chloroflexi bacterium]|nr:LysM peptidoglycan-binding domain-containing protein [Chloroflexota bacterium]